MHISQILAQKAKSRKIHVIQPGRFITPDQAERFISLVSKTAKECRVGWALIGGLALQWHGCPRLTSNCDIAVSSLMGFQELEPIGHRDEMGRQKWASPDGARLTLLCRNDGYRSLYEAAIADARVEAGLRVVQPEYLAAMKFACLGVDHELDLQWLLKRTTTGLVDREKAVAIVRFHLGGQFAEEAFHRALEKADFDVEANGAATSRDYP